MPVTAQVSPPAWFTPTLSALLDRVDLPSAQMCQLMQGIFSGELTDADLAAVLVALRMKGETAEELAAAASVLREHMTPLPTSRADLLDTCGTGGDGLATFNISTATALVVAGAGVPVVKHGNRAVSSRSGSADVLAALGVQLETDAAGAARLLDRAGMCFCMAPLFHPAMKNVAAVRRRLAVRTLFNCLGPLANPARAPYQLLGVGRLEWLDRLADASARLGTRHAFLVHGRDGLDEVTLSAPTLVREVRDGKVTVHEWSAADFGLAPCTLDELRAGSAEDSAATIRDVLRGVDGPARRIVLANAAAALLVAERVADLRDGVATAARSIDTGAAATVLSKLAQPTNG